MTVTAIRQPDRTTSPSVRELMLNGPPPNLSLVRNPLTEEKRVAASIIRVITPKGIVDTEYSSPFVDLDHRLPDHERIRIGWRSGQRNVYNRRTDDPSIFDDIFSLWGLFKKA